MPSHPQPPAQSNPANGDSAGPKKRKHRGGKKRKNRRQSFVAASEADSTVPSTSDALPRDPLVEAPSATPPRMYRRSNRSDESLGSEALLDHRDQPHSMKPRRESRLAGLANMGMSHRSSMFTPGRQNSHQKRPKSREHVSSGDEEDEGQDVDDRTPLIAAQLTHHSPRYNPNYGLTKTKSRTSSRTSARRRDPTNTFPGDPDYDINNPPSVPVSPDIPPQYPDIDNDDHGDHDDLDNHHPRKASTSRRNTPRDALIDIDTDLNDESNTPLSPRPGAPHRHHTITMPVEGDVCFPAETMSEMDFEQSTSAPNGRKHRRRQREWPQMWALEEWSQQEKEQRAGRAGVKKISEPVLIEGRLRPLKHQWHRLDEDVPYRYTYFNEDFESTIHAQTISELVQPGSSFKELFLPDPPVLSDSEESEDEQPSAAEERNASRGPLSPPGHHHGHHHGGHHHHHGRQASDVSNRLNSTLAQNFRSESAAPSLRAPSVQQVTSGEQTPQKTQHASEPKLVKYGEPPTFWLDVLSPTEQEMRVLCKAFGIHALTSEDIMMQEAREKVELFKNYYFINYRTFEQDTNSEDYMEAINMYVIVFRQGILTFHFSQVPHPANVRRRIRQLSDYLALNSDWIGYAIIDDVTDVYQPLIHNIEAEVDEIDELILSAFQDTNELSASPASSPNAEKGDEDPKRMSGIEMLSRIGECRKKVMSLYRLLGNKADVIKGFAKRCTEQWQVAPRSEIGLYLGDIQDHILTMTSNLGHYETLLSRAHSNYLAQVSIRMNERQEQTSDVLGKLTVLGTIVLPLNIICGMWGMNVKVPGQDIDNLNWFWGITAGIFLFAMACYLFCKKVYKIV